MNASAFIYKVTPAWSNLQTTTHEKKNVHNFQSLVHITLARNSMMSTHCLKLHLAFLLLVRGQLQGECTPIKKPQEIISK